MAKATVSPTDEVIPAHYRWNATVLGLDIAFFFLSSTIVSASTILPAFLRHLTSSNLVIGLMAAIFAAGYSLPSLLFAPATERFPRKKALIVWFTPGERIPYLFLAAIAAFLAVSHPAIAVVLALASLVVFTSTGGALTPAWLDLIARAIPTRRRGRFFGRSSALASLLGVGGALLGERILSANPFPNGYVLLFLIAFVFVLISYVCLMLNREQGPYAPARSASLVTWLRTLPHILRKDQNFAAYMLAAALAALGGAAGGFFTVVAISRLGASDQVVAWYNAVLLTTQLVFNLFWGWLADRRGHKLVLVCGQCTLLIAIPVALIAPSLFWYGLVFILFAAALSANNLSRLAIMLEFAPADSRPTYVGLASVAAAPTAFIGPLFGGWLADHFGFPIPFAMFWVACVFGLAVLIRRVQEPRNVRHSGRIVEPVDEEALSTPGG